MVDVEMLSIVGEREDLDMQEYNIVAFDDSNDAITIEGDHSDYLEPMQVFRAMGTDKNNGYNCVKDIEVTDGNTVMYTTRNIFWESVKGTVKIDKPLVDIRGIRDSTWRRVYINRAAGIGVVVRRALTVTFRDCPIERTTDGAVVAYANQLPYNKHLSKHINVENCTFAQLYKDGSLQVYTDKDGDPYPQPGPAIGLVGEGPGGSCTFWKIQNNHIEFGTDCIEIDGLVSNVSISHNRLYARHLQNTHPYYAIRCIGEKENGNGPKDVKFAYNYIRPNDTDGNALAAIVGIIDSAAGPGYVRGPTYSFYNTQDGLHRVTVDEWYQNSIDSDMYARCIPEREQDTIDVSSGPRDIYPAEAWGDFIHTNSGASGAVEFNLPSAKAGMFLVFARHAAQDIELDPLGTRDTLDGSTNKKTYSTQDYFTVRCYKDGKWKTETEN
jgi:hypothetical protein